MSLLEMKNISKSFGGVKALINTHVVVEEGEVHALLGENGAGKSTLMNVLTGVHQMDTGEIVFDGKKYLHPTISHMEEAGIAFVHQEINVVNDLTVFENLFLNREIKTRGGWLNKSQMIKKTKELFDRLGVEIDPRVMVSELKTSEKQLLVICRALYTNAKLLILDEPTTALSTVEVSKLFQILNKLKKEGKSFIFISHKMPEIFDVADRYTVFRNGEFISDGYIKETTPHDIASKMVGEKYVDEDLYESRDVGDVYLELEALNGKGFSDINLSIKKGEILAFTGLAGSGAEALLEAMFGVTPTISGTIKIDNKVVHGNIATFMKNKVGMLPSNRKENSVIMDLNILENMCIAEHSLSKNKQVINIKNEVGKYNNQKERFKIKAASHFDPILSLSGGNQQKVFFAKWLNTEAETLLLDNPTQGVDVGAKAEIYKLILDFAKQGKSIVINTLEIPEIKKVSDRCVVFFEGKIVKIFENKDINEHDVMLYSTNAVEVKGGSDYGNE